MAGRDGDGFVEIGYVDDIEPAEHFARLRERAVGHDSLTVADADRSCARNGVQRRGETVLAPAVELVRELHGFADRFLHRVGAGAFPKSVVVVAQQHVLHGLASGSPEISMTGRISTVPLRAPGMREATSMASSRSLASIR